MKRVQRFNEKTVYLSAINTKRNTLSIWEKLKKWSMTSICHAADASWP
jgi:hypothetical protein